MLRSSGPSAGPCALRARARARVARVGLFGRRRHFSVGVVGDQPRAAVGRAVVLEPVQRARGAGEFAEPRRPLDRLFLPLLDDFRELVRRDVRELLAVEVRGPLERDAALVAVGIRAGDLRIAPRRLRRHVSLDDLGFGTKLRRQIALIDRLCGSHVAFLLLRVRECGAERD